MMRPAFALVLLFALGLAIVAGCGSRKNTLGPDLPPETSVFVQGQIDTVSHRVHLYWFGSDPDGDVVAYQMRFVPKAGNLDPKWDTLFCGLPGRCTDSVFTLFTGDSSLIHSEFQIRSMDDKGLVDPTPATQRFVLTNLAPSVHITNPLSAADSSFGSVTINWDVDDPDGGGPGLRYRIWLNGNEAEYDSTSANTFTVPSARFLEGSPRTYRTGYRTLFVQAVDDGGLSGPAVSMRWFVRAPSPVLDPTTLHGRLLVIDDSRSTSNSNFGVDTMYANVCARAASANPYNELTHPAYVQLPAGTFSILRLQFSNPFRSARDLMQTFRQFDAIVWYRGYETEISPTMQTYQDSIGVFIQGGGRLLLEGLYLIEGHNCFGTLREDFVTRYMNCQRLYQQYDSGTQDSTVGIGVNTTANLHSRMYADTLMRMQRPSYPDLTPPGIRAFVPFDVSQVAASADSSGLLSPTDPQPPLPLAMTVNRFPGRLIVVTFPIRSVLPPPPSNRSLFSSWRLLHRMLFQSPNGLLAP